MCLFKLPNFSTTIMVIYARTPIFNVFRPLHNLGTVSIRSAAIASCADKSEFQAATWGSRFTILIHTRTLGSWVWVQIPAPVQQAEGSSCSLHTEKGHSTCFQDLTHPWQDGEAGHIQTHNPLLQMGQAERDEGCIYAAEGDKRTTRYTHCLQAMDILKHTKCWELLWP